MRFPALDVVIKKLSCSDADKELLRQLFLEVYRIGVEYATRRSEKS